jgi:dedicator of cytokinesis protein 1
VKFIVPYDFFCNSVFNRGNVLILQGVITLGGGVEVINEYRSVIYYHEDKPRWFEIFKVAVPIEEFKGSHLKFMFKHRSSNETKDKTEKPFAMSYVKLMQDNGTTLPDIQHELLVYKVCGTLYSY